MVGEMSDTSQGPGWWEASDGKWYPPVEVESDKPWWRKWWAIVLLVFVVLIIIAAIGNAPGPV